jgi:hypothetical protein
MLKDYSRLTKLNEIKKGQTGTGLLIENDGHIIPPTSTISQIKEDINNGSKFVIPDDFIVSAVFQKYGVKNANGRIYPENVLRTQVDKYIRERVNTRCAIGSLDHPQATTLSGHDVAMNILNLEWQGRTLIGEMKLHISPGYKKYGICSTSGDLVANMLLDNILIGVSSRGVGTVRPEGDVTIVDDDYDIICWDVVCEPSTPNAFIKFNRSELQPFIESKENGNNSLNEKLSRMESILI